MKLRDELVILLNKSQEEKELAGPLADSILTLFQQHEQAVAIALKTFAKMTDKIDAQINVDDVKSFENAYDALHAQAKILLRTSEGK